MRIIYLTAGAAGMYCGSCLQDNAMAKALIRRGHDAMLLPTYTPILTDEQSVSSPRLFFGGLNVYLQQISPLFRWLPKWSDQFLSSPRLVNWVAGRAMGTSARQLGGLTVSMLKGKDGFQRKEVSRLCDWLVSQGPDTIVFSNLLIAGCIPEIKRLLGKPLVVMLQGDDIFYDNLIEPYRSEAIRLLRQLATQVDRFIVHSQFYLDKMRDILSVSESRFEICPLAIDTTDFESLRVQADGISDSTNGPPRIGYLARIAPEKGLHHLVDAFVDLRNRFPLARLEIAGWLGKQNEPYWRSQIERLRLAGLENAYHYHGTVDRQGKLAFLKSIDVLSVPTDYAEPKGLFVLEALAAGVPVIQPDHGAFPELLNRFGGGYLFKAGDNRDLSIKLGEAIASRERLIQLGKSGREAVLLRGSTTVAAARMEAILQALVAPT